MSSPVEHDRVVDGEEIRGGDLDFLLLLAIDEDLDRHVGRVFAARFQVIGQRFDRVGRVARAVPVRRVLAVVEQVLDQLRRNLALGFGGG